MTSCLLLKVTLGDDCELVSQEYVCTYVAPFGFNNVYKKAVQTLRDLLCLVTIAEL